MLSREEKVDFPLQACAWSSREEHLVSFHHEFSGRCWQPELVSEVSGNGPHSEQDLEVDCMSECAHQVLHPEY